VSDVPLRDWVLRWIDTGRVLAAIRRRELQSLTDDEAREAALDLLSMPLPDDLPPRRESGLVEQQRWFSRAHHKG
jgi:hypothetical protein